MTFFSIIIPCFNAEELIDATLNSISLQTCDDLEVILVDGGSNDNTLEVASNYKQIIGYQISEPDNGIYDAINKGIAVSNGTYILVLGAGDKLHSPDILEFVKTKIVHREPKIYFGNVQYENIENKLVPTIHHSSFDWKIDFKNTLNQQGVFYHRSLFPEYLFIPHYHILGDYQVHLRLKKANVYAESTNRIIAICDAGGISKNFRWSLYSQELEIKRNTQSIGMFLLNGLWVPTKFLLKNLFKKRSRD
ncbi:MAG: glycosyltransferase family 2 protein [Flavobacteriales bacterium]